MALWQSLVVKAALERKCSTPSESGVAGIEADVLRGQVSFLFMSTPLPLLLSTASSRFLFMFKDQRREYFSLYPNFNLVPVLPPCYPMRGVSLNVSQRTALSSCAPGGNKN